MNHHPFLLRVVIFTAWPIIVFLVIALTALALVACWPLTLTKLVHWDW